MVSRRVLLLLKSPKRGAKSKGPTDWLRHVLRMASGANSARCHPVSEHGSRHQMKKRRLPCLHLQKFLSLESGRHGWTARGETTHMFRAAAGQGRHRGGRTDLRGRPMTFQVALWEKSELSWISFPFCLSLDGALVFTLKYRRRREVQQSLRGPGEHEYSHAPRAHGADGNGAPRRDPCQQPDDGG